MSSQRLWVICAGGFMGLAGVALALAGNPPNTGICISCFMENAVGALGLHANARMQYMRPELIGFFLGSFLCALVSHEFKPRSSGTGLAQLGFGFFLMVGSAVFIGCPIKALYRLGAGDLTSISGIVGMVAGVWLGLKLLVKAGPRLEDRRREVSHALPMGMVVVAAGLTLLLFVPGVLVRSQSGGGALHAPILFSLAVGLALGALCQRSRFCITGSIRDMLLMKSPVTGIGLYAAVATTVAASIATGGFNLGYYDQPGAHLDNLWSFMGMLLVGSTSVLAGGCPFRQIIKAGEGDVDGATVTMGMVLGAALVQTWELGGTPAGVAPQGKVAVLVGLALIFSLAATARKVRA